MANREATQVQIRMDDLELVRFGGDGSGYGAEGHWRSPARGQLDADLARDVANNTLRYVEMFARAVDELKPEPDAEVRGAIFLA